MYSRIIYVCFQKIGTKIQTLYFLFLYTKILNVLSIKLVTQGHLYMHNAG